jgi:hypothetical protein
MPMWLFACDQDSECVSGTHTFSFHELLYLTQIFTHFSRAFFSSIFPRFFTFLSETPSKSFFPKKCQSCYAQIGRKQKRLAIFWQIWASPQVPHLARYGYQSQIRTVPHTFSDKSKKNACLTQAVTEKTSYHVVFFEFCNNTLWFEGESQILYLSPFTKQATLHTFYRPKISRHILGS